MHRDARLAAMCLLLAIGLAFSASRATAEAPERLVITLATETSLGGSAAATSLSGVFGGARSGSASPRRSLSVKAVYADAAAPPMWLTGPSDLRLPRGRLFLTASRPARGARASDAAQVNALVYWGPEIAQGPINRQAQLGGSALGPSGAGGGGLVSGLFAAPDDPRLTALGARSQLPSGATGRGDYVLNTGNVTATLDGFLPPLVVSSPAQMSEVDPAAGIAVQWQPVPGARGFILHATGMRYAGGRVTDIICWVSTVVQPPDRVLDDYEQETSIADDLARGILLPPETTRCVVPPGIFADVSRLTLTVTAVGNDFYARDGGCTTVGKIRARCTGVRFAGTSGTGALVPAGGR